MPQLGDSPTARTAMFAAALERPPALWNHFKSPVGEEELQPPYGLGHAVSKTNTLRCRFAIDTMCTPISAIRREFAEEMGFSTWKQTVSTSLADPDTPPIISTDMTMLELVVHWNGKRRTMFLECMLWEALPAQQDCIVSMPDALDNGLIAFALPHEWRRSWLGTAAFSNQLPLALRKDRSMTCAMHEEFVMASEDEALIDISERINLTTAHIVTDASSLEATQRYWLSEFPNLNSEIPRKAHPDLPQFNPPFDEKEMQTYQEKNPSKVPRASAKLQDKISDTLGKLAASGICDMHANPVGIASYVVLVPKPDGTLRICINFAKVNKMLLIHHYPLPCCQDLLNQISRSKYYAKVDLKNGFYNFDVAEQIKWITSTVAPGHAFVWNKIPQGLAPVPSWFQWAMTTVMDGLVGVICLIYIDDLIILGNTPEELNANIRLVLARLDKYNLRIAISKCDFTPTTEIEFLGHKISHGKIMPGPKSSAILQGIVNPNHEHDAKDKAAKLNTFIGIVNWFSKYLPDCARKLKPLLDARIGGWTWGNDQETAFTMFRDLLADMQPLYLPSGGANRLEIHTDASKDGWFAVLFEDSGIGDPKDRLKVIAYAGGVFRGPQISWSILQKEMFAMYSAHLKFDHFIRLHEFRLVVDNKTMTYCEISADMMVQRWYLRIQHYNSEIVHMPGILNILPDAGSRLLHLEHPNLEQSQFCSISSQFCNISSAICNASTKGLTDKRANKQLLAALLSHRQLDTIHAELCGCTGDIACDDNSIRQLQQSLSSSSASSLDWTTMPFPKGPNSCSTVTPQQQHSRDWASVSLGDPLQSEGSRTTELGQPMEDWLGDNFPDAASAHSQLTAFSITTSNCARLAAEPSAPQRATAISPEHLHLIRTCHGGAAGHHGRDETIRKLQLASLHWPSRYIDVARYIASCPVCQRFRLKQRRPYAMYKTIFTHAPLFGRWHLDFLSITNPCTFTGATKVLLMEEERSRFVMLHATKAETAIEVVIAMLNTFSIFGIAESVRSDNAANIVEAAVKEFLKITGISHDFSIPHQAHSNGVIESTCGDTSRLLRMLCCDLHAYGRWSLMLPLVQRQLNSLTRSTLGCSANQLLFGNRVNLDRYIIPCAPMAVDEATRAAVANSDPVETFVDTLAIAQRDILHKADQIRIKLLNDNTRQRPFKADEQLTIGQTVLVPWNDKNIKPERFSANFMGPYVVVRMDPHKGSVALVHTISPTPPHEPTSLVSAVSELRLFDDSMAITEYDVPEDRFRQLAYHNHNTRAVNCILAYRPLAVAVSEPVTDAHNFEFEARFDDSTSLIDTIWLPYSSVQHTFAFEAFYHCVNRDITGHQGIAIPVAHRAIHQSRQSVASTRRRRSALQDRAAAAFDPDAMAFRPT